MTLHPKPTEAIFHHVPNNPVRCEQLCRRRDILFADLDVLLQIGKDLILGLCIVILVQPTDDLHRIQPVVLRDHSDKLLQHRPFPQQMLWEQKLGVVIDPLEHAGQNRT